MRDWPPHILARLEHLFEIGGSAFGLDVRNHGDNKFVTIWPFLKDGSANAIGLNDMATDREKLYTAVGKLVCRMAEGLDPITGRPLNPPPAPPNLTLITDDNDHDE